MFRPLQWLYRIVGLHPRGSKTDIYFAITSVVFQFVSLLLFFNEELSIGNKSAKYINIAIRGTFWISGLAHIIKTNYSRVCYNRIDKLVRDSSSDIRSQTRFEISTFAGTCIIFALRSWLSSASTWQDIVKNVLKVLENTFAYTPVIQQALMVHILTSKFCALNNRLRAVPDLPAEQIRLELLVIFKTYFKLRDIVEQINSFFGLYNFLNLNSRLFKTAFATYLLLITFSESALGSVHDDIAICLSVLIATLYQLEVCHKCYAEARKTVQLAHQIIDRDTSMDIMDEVETFSLTMFDSPVKLTAAGVFSMDRGLITKATMASVTCILIALQLKDVHIPDSTDSVISGEMFTSIPSAAVYTVHT